MHFKLFNCEHFNFLIYAFLSFNYVFRSSGSRTRTRMTRTSRGCRKTMTGSGRKSGFIALMKSNSFSTVSWWGPWVFIRPLWTSRPGRYTVVLGGPSEVEGVREIGGSSARPKLPTGMKEAPRSARKQRAAWRTSHGTAALTGSDSSWDDPSRWVTFLISAFKLN